MVSGKIGRGKISVDKMPIRNATNFPPFSSNYYTIDEVSFDSITVRCI